MKWKNKLRLMKDIARQRIALLYRLALTETRWGRYWLARRYIELIIRIAHKARIRPPRYIRRGYCRKCHIPLIPGLTSRVRIRSEGHRGSRVVVTCLMCGWKRRYMIKTRSRALSRKGDVEK